jgi:hypothetical protein
MGRYTKAREGVKYVKFFPERVTKEFLNNEMNHQFFKLFGDTDKEVKYDVRIKQPITRFEDADGVVKKFINENSENGLSVNPLPGLNGPKRVFRYLPFHVKFLHDLDAIVDRLALICM